MPSHVWWIEVDGVDGVTIRDVMLNQTFTISFLQSYVESSQNMFSYSCHANPFAGWEETDFLSIVDVDIVR